MKIIFFSVLLTLGLFAQSFFVLTGVKQYDPVVASIPELEQYNADIKAMMVETSNKLHIDMRGQPSSVLACVVRKFSVGETVGIRVALELAEYMKRDGKGKPIFAITYEDMHMFALDKESIEDDLIDTVEELLSKFAHQYKEDNKDLSKDKEGVTHENFAAKMGYETSYTVALAKAKKTGKPLFIFMTTTYCPWCRKLEDRILTKAEIDQKIHARYVPVMLNFNTKQFPKQFQAIGLTPTLYIVDSHSEKILHQFVGYSARDEFLDILK